MILTNENDVCVCVCLIRIHVIKSGENPDELKKKKKKRLTLKHLSKTKLIITFKLNNQGVCVFIAICMASLNNVFWISSLLKILLKKITFFIKIISLRKHVISHQMHLSFT